MAPEQSSQTEPEPAPIPTPEPSHDRQSQVPSIQQPQVAQYHDGQPVPFNSYPGAYGQQFAPYPHRPVTFSQPQPQPQQGYAVVTASSPPEKPSWKITKDVAHVLVLLISIIGIGISFSTINSDSTSDYYDDYIEPSVLAMAGGPLFCVSFLWSLAELVTRCSRGFKAGIHPGAHVGLCLCIWMGALAVGILIAVLVSWSFEDCSGYYDSRNVYHDDCKHNSKPKFIAVIVLSLLLAVVEFFLFVAGCIDTHKRNRFPHAVHQVPLQGTAQGGQDAQQMSAAAPPQKQSWKITKDAVHVIVIVMSLIGMGMALSVLSNTHGFSTYYRHMFLAEVFGPIFIIAALWSAAELITRFCRKWKSGIHPGAHVGICLCTWLVTLIVAIMFTFLYYDGCYSDDSYGPGYHCRAYGDKPIYLGVLVLAYLLIVAEFFLFIGACVDTHRLNRIKHTYVVAPASYWAQPPPQGWYPPQQMQMQPQQPVTSEKGVLAQNDNYQQQQQQHNVTEFYSPGQNGNGQPRQQQPPHNVTEFYSPGTAV